MTTMSQYIRLTKGLNDKGQLIKPDEVWNKIQDNDRDWYLSLYHYNDSHRQLFNEKVVDTKTNKLVVRGCSGIRDVTTDKIWFDLDSPDVEESRKDTIEVVSRLLSKNINKKDIEVYFSGGKGFHVLITVRKTLNPETVQALALKYAGDLKTFDKTMYDAPQLLRVAGTKHHKTGLYKIPLTVEELNNLSADQIKDKAKSLDNIQEISWGVVNPPDDFFDVPPSSRPKSSSTVKATYSLDLSKKPSNWTNCKWSLLQGNFKEGERHEALMILAATCRGLGYDKDTTYYMCKSALKKQSLITGQEEFNKEELWTNIIEQSVFKDNWEGGQYTCKKPSWLQDYCNKLEENKCKERDEELKPVKISDIEDSFKFFIKNLEENTILTGIPPLDKKMPLTTGMHLGVVGAAASGKTALALNILKNTSDKGVISVFASLDMHRNRLFEKLIYKTTGLSREEVYQKFKNDEADTIITRIKEEYKNVWFYDRSSPTVQDIRDYIIQIEKETNQKVKLVMIDYFERVNSDRSEDTAASKDIAGKLQDMVNDLNICLITLVQPNKFSLGAGPDTPITSYTAIKGSSFLYQSFRSIISIWRPFFNPEWKDHDKFMQMAILKNDLGEIDLFNFGWAGKRGDIYGLTHESEEELKMLLKQKNEQNAKNKSEWE